jgi:hypothetical protein
MTHQTLSDAKTIVNNPQAYAEMPGLRIMAWATLKAARGQTVVQHRLAQPARNHLRLMYPGAAS